MTAIEILEVNWAIAGLELPADEILSDRFGRPLIYEEEYNDGNGAYIALDYCNNWEDMGPLIAREGINLTFSAAGVTAHANGHTCTADTPTMAAALCYVKTKNINTTQRA